MTATLPTLQGRARISNSPLEGMLWAIGVEPIPQAFVDDHMALELANAPPSTRLGRFLHRRGCSRFPFDDFLPACLGFLCVMGVIALVTGLLTWSLWFAGMGTVLVVVTGGFWVEIVFGGLLIDFARGPAYWQTTSVKYMYLGRLPAFVRERMELVQTHIPGVRFEVADLCQDRYSLDPVLFAELDGEKYAIAIWKEQEEIHLF
ncbi:MAG: hypothetical protein Q7S26_01095 [bacterium]|nr:hypothetical protein [bacterium]